MTIQAVPDQSSSDAPALMFRKHGHEGQWSDVPAVLAMARDFSIAVAFAMIFLAFNGNSFTSATIEVGADQKVISTGPYRIVRRPMYAGALLMLLFAPLAVGSTYGLVLFPPILAVIVWRLLDEEKFLAERLPGV